MLGTTPVDLLQVDGPARVVAAATAAAPLDAVVFAAGVVAFGPVLELDDDVLDELLLVNLIAPVRLLRAAAAVLPRGGVVVQLSAVVAETPLPGMAAYAASKAALTAFDRAAGRELRRQGIRGARRPPRPHRDGPRHAPGRRDRSEARLGPHAGARRGAHRAGHERGHRRPGVDRLLRRSTTRPGGPRRTRG